MARAGRHGIHRQAALDLRKAMAPQQMAALARLGSAMGPQSPGISNGQPFLFFVVPRAQFDSSYQSLQIYTAQARECHVLQMTAGAC